MLWVGYPNLNGEFAKIARKNYDNRVHACHLHFQIFKNSKFKSKLSSYYRQICNMQKIGVMSCFFLIFFYHLIQFPNLNQRICISYGYQRVSKKLSQSCTNYDEEQ